MRFGDSRDVNALLKEVPLPKMARVRQLFPTERLENPREEIRAQLRRPELCRRIRPGMRIAVTAGSRGIDNMNLMLRETVSFLKERGAEPFLIPAMGSHGGATARGQVEVLKRYGVTADSMGAPIRATMEVVQIASLSDGRPVYIDRYAHEADGIVVVNRVKPHNLFHGRYESGLFKMMAVGLGKQYGAAVLHDPPPSEMGANVQAFGEAILHTANILFGLATIENAFDKTYAVRALLPGEMEEEEPRLLEKARSLMPCLYPRRLDVLVVDLFGKNFSGVGMDPNVTSTFPPSTGIENWDRAERIAVLDLTEETHGAANGIGMADTITRRLFDKIDVNIMYPNSLTTKMCDCCRIPMVFDSQRLAIQAAILMTARADRDRLRLVRIPNTLHIGEIQVSEALLPELAGDGRVEILSAPEPMEFDEKGDLF